MLNYINDFVLYHPYTITGLYLFMGILLGFVTQYLLLSVANFLTKITKKPFNKYTKKVFNNIPIIFFSVWGIYNTISRLVGKMETVDILTKGFNIFSTYLLCLIILRFVLAIINHRSKKDNESLSSASIVENVVKIIGYIVIIFIILTQLGIPITPILTALGVGGIAVALAFQDILSNLFSGIFVIASSQIKPGDFVKLDGGVEGFIADISWRNTTIRELSGNYIYVPNSKIATSNITNYRHPDYELSFSVPFSVAYDSDLYYVEKIAKEVAKEIQLFEPGAVKNYDPIVRANKFGDYSIECTAIMRASTYLDKYALSSKFVKKLHVKFREVGIKIPFPITTIKEYNEHIIPLKQNIEENNE